MKTLLFTLTLSLFIFSQQATAKQCQCIINSDGTVGDSCEYESPLGPSILDEI